MVNLPFRSAVTGIPASGKRAAKLAAAVEAVRDLVNHKLVLADRRRPRVVVPDIKTLGMMQRKPSTL